jgi:hypothetical protein
MLAHAQSDILKLLEDLKIESGKFALSQTDDFKKLQQLIVSRIDLIHEKIERRISELM